MPYCTKYEGTLNFAEEMTIAQLAHLTTLIEEAVEDHPEWGELPFRYVDFKVAENYLGIQWNEINDDCEEMVEQVNFITRQMRRKFPDFRLSGHLLAQGEVPSDRWVLKIDDDGYAFRQDAKDPEKTIECPHCHQSFSL